MSSCPEVYAMDTAVGPKKFPRIVLFRGPSAFAVAQESRSGTRWLESLSDGLGMERPCIARGFPARGKFMEHVIEFPGVDGLGEVAIHARGEAALTVAFHGMSRQRNDRQVRSAGAFFLAKCGGGFEPVHLRHLHIHQHEVKAFLLDGLERFASIGRQDNLVSPLFEQPHRQALVHRIVFGEQHAQNARRLARVSTIVRKLVGRRRTANA